MGQTTSGRPLTSTIIATRVVTPSLARWAGRQSGNRPSWCRRAGPRRSPPPSARGGSGRVALDGGAEVGSREGGAGEAPVGPRWAWSLGPRPTGAAAGRRQYLPARPATGSGSPVGSRATGPVRGQWLEAILAEGREVDREIDTADGPLGEIYAPVEHGRRKLGGGTDGTYVLQRNLQGGVIVRGARSCGRRAQRRRGRRRGHPPPIAGRQPACRSRRRSAARSASRRREAGPGWQED